MFCKNCGKEIEDNVKFCSYCGYNFQIETTTEKIISSKMDSKLKVGFTLNFVSLIIALTIFLGASYVLGQAGIDEYTKGFSYALIPMLAVVLTSVLGFYVKTALTKDKTRVSMSYLYLVATLISTILTIIGSIFVFPFMLCFVGLIYFVPAILQIIASTKFFQATK